MNNYIEILNSLLKSVDKKKTHHASLFIRENRDDNLVFDSCLLFLRKLLCLNSENNFDNCKCKSCELFFLGINPDLYFLYPKFTGSEYEKMSFLWRTFFLDKNKIPSITSWTENIHQSYQKNNLFIAKEDIYELFKWLNTSCFISKKKVVFIFSVESLNLRAANAILKNLEEPAPDTFFVLYSENKSKIIPTIISRCSQINLSYSNKREIYKEEVEKNLEFNEETDHFFDIFISWMRYCFLQDFFSLEKIANDLSKNSKIFQENFFSYARSILLEALKISMCAKFLNSSKISVSEKNFLAKFVSKIKKKESLEKIIEELLLSHFLSQNINVKFLFMSISLKILSVFDN